MAWHWIDPARRAAWAARALARGGVVALIGRRVEHHDRELEAHIHEAFHTYGPATRDRPPLPDWAVPELRDTPSLSDLRVHEVGEEVEVTTQAYLDQLQTLSPFRRRTPENQRKLLAALRTMVDARGGRLLSRTVTSLVLARKL